MVTGRLRELERFLFQFAESQHYPGHLPSGCGLQVPFKTVLKS